MLPQLSNLGDLRERRERLAELQQQRDQELDDDRRELLLRRQRNDDLDLRLDRKRLWISFLKRYVIITSSSFSDDGWLSTPSYWNPSQHPQKQKSQMLSTLKKLLPPKFRFFRQ